MFRGLSLFSGIGGIDLGLKMALGEDYQTKCYVEIDPYCQRILEARIKDGGLDRGAIWDDITTFDGRSWRGSIDLISGGFPCQDISVAGKGAGILAGKRSGLWREYARLIGEIRPRYVFIENVAALLHRGLNVVLSDLAEVGYDAEWGSFRASDVGAPQRRERIFILAYARCGSDGKGESQRFTQCGSTSSAGEIGEGLDDLGVVNSEVVGRGEGRSKYEPNGWRDTTSRTDGALEYREVIHDSSVEGLEGQRQGWRGFASGEMANTTSLCGRQIIGIESHRDVLGNGRGISQWPPGPADRDAWRAILDHYPDLSPAIEKTTESEIRGVAPRTASRVDRLRSLGNSVVPLQAAFAFRELAARLT